MINKLAEEFYEAKNFLYLGRGPDFALALEGALKLKEISYIHAEGAAAGELKHGMIALVDHHVPVLMIAPKNAYYEKTISNIEEVSSRGGKVIALGSENDHALRDRAYRFIPSPEVKDSLSQLILMTIPLQLFAYYVAVHRGTDVDQPRNLAKSVTVE